VNEINFICGGLIKSGTTLLQKTIDYHPDVCCLIEQEFTFLLELFIEENKNLNLHGYLSTDFNLSNYFFNTVNEIVCSECEVKTKGINENKFLVNNSFQILEAFDEIKLIFITRNPFDLSLSTWDHEKRIISKGYVNKREKEKLPSSFQNLQKFLIERAKLWNLVTSRMFAAKEKFLQRVLIIRYEDLVNNKINTLSKIFKFLNVKTSSEIIDEIAAKTTFDRMKEDSLDPSFYKEARLSYGNDPRISKETFNKINSIAKHNIKKLNYESYKISK